MTPKFDYPMLKVERLGDGKVLRATLTAEGGDPRNFVDDQLNDDLLAFFTDVIQDLDARVIVLTGSGGCRPDAYFSVGGPLYRDAEGKRRLVTDNPRAHLANETLHQRRCRVILECDKPVIAAINGTVAGAGFDLASACDFRIAADHAKFTNAYMRVGITPAAALYLLPPLVGIGWAKRLALTGMVIDAAKAHEIGLVEQIVSADEFDDAVTALADKLASLPPQTMAAAKRLLNQPLQADAIAKANTWLYADVFARHLDDYVEGYEAFFQKRPAKYKGR